MPSLQISALGSPEIRLDNERIAVKPKKALALLIYLAAAERAQTRDALATLLWPESGQRQARAALRRRLSELAHGIGEGWLEADGETLRMAGDGDVTFDVRGFEAALAACNRHGHAPGEVCAACREPLETAARLYRDDFLTGFTLSDCGEFDDWQFFQAEALRQKLGSVLERLVILHTGRDEAEEAIAYARRWIALDPLHEEAHRALMRAYDAAGHRSAAMRQYELCTQTLEAELGARPEAETSALLEAIRLGRMDTGRSGVSLAAHMTPGHTAGKQADEPVAADIIEDEVRKASVLALDIDAEDEGEWDRRPEAVSERITMFLQDALRVLARYKASVLHAHDSGLQAAFGLEGVHEDDAERALHAAFALREAAAEKRLIFTAGVATGMVYVSRAREAGSVSATGPTVQIAARLLGQARRGLIVVDADTHYQTELAARFVPYAVSVRGGGEGGTAFAVVRPRRHAVKSRGLGSLRAPLVGRAEEMAQLRAALQQAVQGHGQLVTVVGEAGLGKSRLVAELRASVDGAVQGGDVLWLEGRCQEMMQQVAYWPFVDILQSNFGWMPHTPEAERAKQVASTLQALQQEGRLSDEQVEVMGPILGRLLSLRYGNEWDDRLRNARPEQVRYQTFETLRDFAAAMAGRQPLALVLEDLHWADALSLDLVSHLLETLPGLPILLLCVYRPESALAQDRLAVIASRKCPGAYREIRLRELTPVDSRALVEGLLHVEGLTAAARNRILDSCQGNPFFLEEVVHDLIEADLIYRDGEVWRARQEIDATPVPGRVQNVILARYDRLEAAHKVAAQHAAVIGRLFTEGVLARALPPNVNMDEALDGLEAHALIYAERTAPERVYSFRHVLAQEAIYQTIPGRRRAAIHTRMGEALEAIYAERIEEAVDPLAYHYDRSDAATKAVEYLLRAGDKAARAYLTEEAVAHFERALERIDELEGDGPDEDERMRVWRFHALGELGKTLMRSSRYDDAERYLRQAIAYGKEHGLPVKEVVRLHWWLGDLLMNWNVRCEETLQTGLDGLAMLPDAERESGEAAMMYSIIGFGYQLVGKFEEFHETAAQLAAFLPQLPYFEEFRVCYGCIIDSFWQRGDLDTATAWLRQAEEQARTHHHDWALAEHLWVRAYDHFFRGGSVNGAVALAKESLALFERVGDAKRVSWAENAIGDLLGDYGLSSQAEDQFRKALPSTSELDRENLPDILLKLASSYLAQRKWDEAEETLHETIQEMDVQQQNLREALTLLGFVALARGNVVEASERFMEALEAMIDPDIAQLRWHKWWLMINSLFANALYGLECALDDKDMFRSFLSDYRARHPAAENAVFRQWSLEPGEPEGISDVKLIYESFCREPQGAWSWEYLDDSCHFEVGQGLILWTPATRDLWRPLINAPRLLRSVHGDFSAEVTCAPACEDRPGIGGILLWQSKYRYLRLCVGVRAQDEMSLEGCIDDKDVAIGRGRLVGEPVTLRMERFGGRVRALCSADGVNWYSVGEVEFPPAEPEEVGLVAIGFPDRTIYHAPYADGTAIRFTDFCLWN